MATKAYIFDLDGTLVDTLKSIAYFGNSALEQFGFPPIEADRYRELVGKGAKRLVHDMLKESGNDKEENFHRVYPLYHDSYDQNPLHLAAPYRGIPELLEELKRRGIKLAILSNKPHSATEQIATALFGAGCFDLIYGQREGVPLKPDPTAVHAILAELSVAPDEAVYVGDTATDMKTGKNAGLCTVGVLWGFREEPELRAEAPQGLVSRAEELLRFIK